jgi:hypothetical protein
MAMHHWRKGRVGKGGRPVAHHRRVNIEQLEERLALTWNNGIPPGVIAIPKTPTFVALKNNDATGKAAITTTEIDYYTFVATATGAYIISTGTPTSDLNTVLGVFSSTGQRLAFNDDISSSNTDSRLSVNLKSGLRYYVGITNFNIASRGAYTWTIDGPATVIQDDIYENNDTMATATNLGTLAGPKTINNLVMADSADWYKFTTVASSGLTVQINFIHAQGDLDMEVYDSTGALIGASRSLTNKEEVSFDNLLAGTYFVKVFGYQGAFNPHYSLSIQADTDLVGSGLSFSTPTPWGSTVDVSAAVTNTGSVAAGQFNVQFYLSTDPVGSADDVLIPLANGGGNSVTVPGVGGNTFVNLAATLQLPSAPPAGFVGVYFYVIMKVDSSNQVQETDETNNFGQAGVGLDYLPIQIVGNTAIGNYNIQLVMNDLTPFVQSLVQAAAYRWEQVIVGDVPDVGGIDDVELRVNGLNFGDGVGGAMVAPGGTFGGSNGFYVFRVNNFPPLDNTPIEAPLDIDLADIASVTGGASYLPLYNQLIREMGHALGFGQYWAGAQIAPTTAPFQRFVGPLANAAFEQVFKQGSVGVPVQPAQFGIDKFEWRDVVLNTTQYLFGDEVMSGTIGPGEQDHLLPISIITVESFADMGYVVNTAAADPYDPFVLNPSAGAISNAIIRIGPTSNSLLAKSSAAAAKPSAVSATSSASPPTPSSQAVEVVMENWLPGTDQATNRRSMTISNNQDGIDLLAGLLGN